jgi:hypothetical protein
VPKPFRSQREGISVDVREVIFLKSFGTGLIRVLVLWLEAWQHLRLVPKVASLGRYA